ncbi:MAG: Gfo/Idh/MocA family oxidoreductase [Actinobacteria bacterium]|nr:Gfo/Idh/MocA family oxidoreductase [Actinomycetota bacterium]
MSQAETTRRIGVALLGSSFMGRAHSRGLDAVRTLEDHPAAVPALRAICGRDQKKLDGMRDRYGWERTSTDWRALVEDPEIEVFDNAASNHLHAEPTIAAARAGKHVICEKPLGRDAAETRKMLEAVETAGVLHMCAFNYRFLPAIRFARELIERGDIGAPRQFRSRFLLGSGAVPGEAETAWRLRRETAGSGVVGDLLAHHVDVARYLVGEFTAVGGATRTWGPQRAGVEVDVEDAVVATVEFASGAIGTMEAARVLPGQVLESAVAIDGSEGSVTFDVRSPNELTFADARGSTTISVTAPEHPFAELWWPRGHGIGWGDSFSHELRHFLGAVAGAWEVAPHGATFLDGLRCAEVCDAVLAAATSGHRTEI